MKEVYLYFRTQATLGSDNAAGDSACYPLSHFCGAVPSADDTLNLYFKPMIGVQQNTDDDVAEVLNNDKIVVSLLITAPSCPSACTGNAGLIVRVNAVSEVGYIETKLSTGNITERAISSSSATAASVLK